MPVTKKRAIGIFSLVVGVALVILVQGFLLTDNKIRFASHAVTLNRHDNGHIFAKEEKNGISRLIYEGEREGVNLKITIDEQHNIAKNGVSIGQLKKGDAVFIGDEGITINNMNYEQSDKYLQESLKQTPVQAANRRITINGMRVLFVKKTNELYEFVMKE